MTGFRRSCRMCPDSHSYSRGEPECGIFCLRHAEGYTLPLEPAMMGAYSTSREESYQYYKTYMDPGYSENGVGSNGLAPQTATNTILLITGGGTALEIAYSTFRSAHNSKGQYGLQCGSETINAQANITDYGATKALMEAQHALIANAFVSNTNSVFMGSRFTTMTATA